jgi:hypothetical protein
MNNTPNREHTARILRHGQRADEITREAIETRARELVIIAGRPAREVNDSDRTRALDELRGQHLPDTSLDDDEGAAGLSRDPSEPIAVSGQRTPIINEPEEQEVQERLVLEGVEEAQHDQMLADRRRRET